jgi:hypothetical protein
LRKNDFDNGRSHPKANFFFNFLKSNPVVQNKGLRYTKKKKSQWKIFQDGGYLQNGSFILYIYLLLDTTPYYQQFRIKKIFLTKPLVGVSVEFLFRKNQPVFVFGRHFGFSPTINFFKKKTFELKSIYRIEISLFSEFCQIF